MLLKKLFTSLAAGLPVRQGRWEKVFVEYCFIFKTRRKIMAYSKPAVLAQNSKQGVFAAGCPAQNVNCRTCERTK